MLTPRKPDEHFWVRLIFPFEEFELTMRREARMVYIDQGHGRFGCVFLGVSERHAEVLRYLVDAYLAGELVSAGDLLQARAREDTPPVPMQTAPMLRTRHRGPRSGGIAPTRRSDSPRSPCSLWSLSESGSAISPSMR